MTFAQKLRELRDAAGLSEAKLAVAAQMSAGTIHQYALGRRAPSYLAVVKIARALGVDCTAFADCEPVKPPPRKKPATKSRQRKK